MGFVLKNMKREQVLVALAYGFFLACTSVTLWGGYLRFLTAQESPDALMLEYFVRTATLPLSLAVSGLVAFRHPKARLWRSPVLALVLFLAGALLVVLQNGGVIPSGWSLVVVGACFGWGSGLMFGALQEVVAAQKVFTAGIVVFVAAGISALLFFAVEVLPANAAPWASLFAFAPIAVLLTRIAWKCAPKVHPMFDTVPEQRRDRCREAASELWRPLLCVAFSAFIVGIVRVGSLAVGGSIGQTNESNMIGLLAASVALLATWKLLYERVTLMRLYQILFPLTATAFLLLPLLEGTFHQVVRSLVFLVFSVTSSLMVVSCARTARNQSLAPVLVYGLFAGIVYACSLAGSVVGLYVGAGRGVGLAELSVVALVAVYALSVAMVAPHGRKARRGKAASGEELSPSSVDVAGDTVSAGCAVAVERYRLSRREAEVLDLLARGRDVPYVAEELVISKNTVRTHTKSIFAKTGVHSRQELIDLVESIEA
ncbi:helix-turn-helix transcriptional regulator [Eggerthella timonensis]|uniref:helix-turn-helix transcriptional regulator n=1 Tax=Eggerthella timonensis TaxID=1871008 RepID=UPI001FE7AFA1|nr:helix-turn-helix transcriptional regulator [Eggerthella timonensis]